MKLTWCHNRLAIGSARNGEEPILKDSAKVAEILSAADVTHLINLRRDPGFMSAVATVEVLRGIVAYWNPAEDDGLSKPVEWFWKSVHFAMTALAFPGHKVAVVCCDGNNRAPSTALAILMAQGLSYRSARSLVVGARPGALIRYAEDAEKAVKELGYC